MVGDYAHVRTRRSQTRRAHVHPFSTYYKYAAGSASADLRPLVTKSAFPEMDLQVNRNDSTLPLTSPHLFFTFAAP